MQMHRPLLLAIPIYIEKAIHKWLAPFGRFLEFFRQNLIYRSAFALCRETSTQQSSDGWCYIDLTDSSFGQEVFFDTRAGSHKDWGYRSIEVPFGCGQAVAVQTVETFVDGEEDIAAFWTIYAQQNAVFITHCDTNYTFACSRISVAVSYTHLCR